MSFISCALLALLPNLDIVTTAAGLKAAILDTNEATSGFDLTLKISCILDCDFQRRLIVGTDASDNVMVRTTVSSDTPHVKPGDTVRVQGHLSVPSPIYTRFADATTITLIAQGQPPRAKSAHVRDILAGIHDWEYTTCQGIIRDVLPSETSEIWTFIFLGAENELLRISIPSATPEQQQAVQRNLQRLIGRTVSVTGIPNLNCGSNRLFGGREFYCPGSEYIKLLDTRAPDPLTTPDIKTIVCTPASTINTMGWIKAQGLVLCTWQGHDALLRTIDNDTIRLVCEDGNLPPVGSCIEAIGLPQSDIYRITLTHASWRRTIPLPIVVEQPLVMSAERVMDLKELNRKIDSHLHGRAIQIRGKVRNLPDSPFRDNTILLEHNGAIVPLDVSSAPDSLNGLTVDSEITVSGFCLMNTEYRKPGLIYPQITSYTLIVRDPEDLVITKPVSWWNRTRLLILAAGLILLVALIGLWNILLRNLANRKGRELLDEKLRRVRSDLKAQERTHLAVELHDSLAQTLTGVSLEVDTAVKVADTDPQTLKTHLTIAAKALKSCRDELRNCLWDLRNRALEAPTMNEAICQTLAPHVSEARFTTRFDVPRERICDNTAHAILRIIRELVLNSIRHGKSTHIDISGHLDGKNLAFTVQDNGCGFDFAKAPGFSQGHYGLLGIQERVDEFEGEFNILSVPGEGTRVTIALPILNDTSPT